MTGSSDRRSTLSRLGALLMGLIGAALSTPAALFLLSPLRRSERGTTTEEDVPLLRLNQVPDLDQGGRPLRAVVMAQNVRDAFTRFPSVRLGAVWLYRRGREVTCLATACPHAGCAIDYDEPAGHFVCPCHRSSFSVDGVRREGPSPRDMDRLDVDVKDGEVRCRYRRFRPAIAKKEPV